MLGMGQLCAQPHRERLKYFRANVNKFGTGLMYSILLRATVRLWIEVHAAMQRKERCFWTATVPTVVTRLLTMIAVLLGLQSTVNEFDTLDDRLLSDIGLTRDQVQCLRLSGRLPRDNHK
jgi:uncharacterized protein YjiS (DUF1127 family)